MPTAIAGIVTSALAVAIGIGVVALIACAYLVPVNIWRMAKHLRGVHEQLERIAVALERAPSAGLDEFRELELARRRRPPVDAAVR